MVLRGVADFLPLRASTWARLAWIVYVLAQSCLLQLFYSSSSSRVCVCVCVWGRERKFVLATKRGRGVKISSVFFSFFHFSLSLSPSRGAGSVQFFSFTIWKSNSIYIYPGPPDKDTEETASQAGYCSQFTDNIKFCRATHPDPGCAPTTTCLLLSVPPCLFFGYLQNSILLLSVVEWEIGWWLGWWVWSWLHHPAPPPFYPVCSEIWN